MEGTLWASYTLDAITNVVIGGGWFSEHQVADIAAGMYAFSGILAALYRRNATGEGAILVMPDAPRTEPRRSSEKVLA